MIELPISTLGGQFEALRERLAQADAAHGDPVAILTQDGAPSLVVLPYDLYVTLLDLAPIPPDPHTLLHLPAAERQRVMTIAALVAERHYHTDPDLTDHEAFAEEDMDDVVEEERMEERDDGAW